MLRSSEKIKAEAKLEMDFFAQGLLKNAPDCRRGNDVVPNLFCRIIDNLCVWTFQADTSGVWPLSVSSVFSLRMCPFC